jgi:hypothetical protein
MKILSIKVSGPALGWLDRFDANGPRAYEVSYFDGGFVH